MQCGKSMNALQDSPEGLIGALVWHTSSQWNVHISHAPFTASHQGHGLSHPHPTSSIYKSICWDLDRQNLWKTVPPWAQGHWTWTIYVNSHDPGFAMMYLLWSLPLRIKDWAYKSLQKYTLSIFIRIEEIWIMLEAKTRKKSSLNQYLSKTLITEWRNVSPFAPLMLLNLT